MKNFKTKNLFYFKELSDKKEKNDKLNNLNSKKDSLRISYLINILLKKKKKLFNYFQFFNKI